MIDRFEFRELTAAEIAECADVPACNDYSVSTKGSFEFGKVLLSPRRALKAMPDPETVKCESCGNSVFLLSVRGSDVPEVKHWFEPAVQVASGSFEMLQHTPKRCQAAREDDCG